MQELFEQDFVNLHKTAWLFWLTVSQANHPFRFSTTFYKRSLFRCLTWSLQSWQTIYMRFCILWGSVTYLLFVFTRSVFISWYISTETEDPELFLYTPFIIFNLPGIAFKAFRMRCFMELCAARPRCSAIEIAKRYMYKLMQWTLSKLRFTL